MSRILKTAVFFLCLITPLFDGHTSSEVLKLLTYNTGLAHTFVPLAPERLPKISEVLQTHNADVLCLQEVWARDDQKSFVKALSKEFPYSLVSPIEQQEVPEAPACKYGDLFGEGKFVTCFQSKCKGLEGDEFTACVINDCRGPMDDLKNSKRFCAQALLSQVGKNPILSILTLLNPFARPGVFTYKGAVGTMLFSKLPIKAGKSGFKDLKNISTLNHRGVLFATVEKGGREHFVSCNHLTANLTHTAPYAGNFASWEQENLEQIKQLLDFAKGVAGNAGQYHMGDFNCSFQNSERQVQGDFENGCSEFLRRGLSDPISENSPACSFCRSNTLDDSDDNMLLDHIFTLNTTPSEQIQAGIVLKQLVKVNVKKKGVVETNLSDHFGVQVNIPLD